LATSHPAATSLLGAEYGHDLRAGRVAPSGMTDGETIQRLVLWRRSQQSGAEALR